MHSFRQMTGLRPAKEFFRGRRWGGRTKPFALTSRLNQFFDPFLTLNPQSEYNCLQNNVHLYICDEFSSQMLSCYRARSVARIALGFH